MSILTIIAYYKIAKDCSIEPEEVAAVANALQRAVNAARLTRPGEVVEAIQAISTLVSVGLSDTDGQRLANEIARYGDIDTWLSARDAKKEAMA